jgi:hypothetical protein
MKRVAIRVAAPGLVLYALLLGNAAVAAETAIQISPRIGTGTVRIDADRTPSRTAEDHDAVSIGVNMAVVTPIGLLVEGGIGRDATFSLFNIDDSYELTQYSLALGYQFETANGFRLVPKGGRTRWKLYDEDGRLFIPGPDDTLGGYEYFWELTLQKRVGRSSAIGVSYRDNAFEFGSARAVVFTVTFNM